MKAIQPKQCSTLTINAAVSISLQPARKGHTQQHRSHRTGATAPRVLEMAARKCYATAEVAEANFDARKGCTGQHGATPKQTLDMSVVIGQVTAKAGQPKQGAKHIVKRQDEKPQRPKTNKRTQDERPQRPKK